MVEDAGAPLVLVQDHLAARLAGAPGSLIGLAPDPGGGGCGLTTGSEMGGVCCVAVASPTTSVDRTV